MKENSPAFSGQSGLTKREYYASQAMQGILSGYLSDKELEQPRMEWVASIAVEAADELMDALADE